MKIVRVTYTVNAAYVEQNQQNIRSVMADLQKLNYAGVNYHCCLGPDGQTFTHQSFFKSDEDHKLLNELPAFKFFQEQLKANGFVNPPKQEFLTLVGTSTPIFNH